MPGPDGTRPWRKTWRKKWREESSYRSLTLLQREFLTWIECNCDDEGRTPPTGEHLLAKLFSSPQERVSRDAVHRAAVALERAGLVMRRPHSLPHREPHRPRTVYVRVNWKEYQGKEEAPAQPAAQAPVNHPHRDSRGKQKNAEEEKPTPAEPALPEGTDWKGLVEAMTTAWSTRYGGAKLVLLGKDWKPLRALVVSLTDEEVYRRWVNYLANQDPFYAGHPVGLFISQVNRFVVAPASTSYREPWEGESPKGPAEWRETQ